ncbi:MAG: RDD family protein [Bdellovibrionia bacterium]
MPLSSHDSSVAVQTPPRVKVKAINRIVAKGIDLALIFAIALAVPFRVGPLLGFLYSLFADGIQQVGFEGQSIGKKIMHLQVVNQITRAPANWKESVLRNAPIGVATFFGMIPIWGWLILLLIGVPLMFMEIYLMIRVDTGHRLGDVMGETEVIEKGSWQ